MIRSILSALVAGALLLPSIAQAQEPPPPPPRPAPVASLLRSDRALTGWLEQRNAEVHAADARVLQAQADLGTAKLLLPNPALDATLGGIPLGSGSFGSQSNFGVGITQTVELGKRGPRIDAADLRAREAKRTRDATLSDKISDARTALARVAYLKARLDALTESLGGSKKVADLQKARFDKGAVSGLDLDRLLLDNLSIETDLGRGQADLKGALAACQALLHAPCDPGAASAADIDAAAPLPAGLGADGLQRRPDVEAARLEGAAAEQDAVLARRKAIPDPAFRLGYYRDATLPSAVNTLQLGVTIPLPFFDHGQHDEAKANAKVMEQRHVAESLVAAAEGNRAALLEKRAFLESALETLKSSAVPRSASVHEATVKALDRGQVTMTDLLLARRTHLTLLLTELDLHFEYFTVRSDLRHTLGLDVAGAAQPAPAPAQAPAK